VDASRGVPGDVSPGRMMMSRGIVAVEPHIPPFASGGPIVSPPTFTWTVVAPRALDAENTNNRKHATERARELSARATAGSSPSTHAEGIEPGYLTLHATSMKRLRDSDTSVGKRPYAAVLSISREGLRVARSTDAMPILKRRRRHADRLGREWSANSGRCSVSRGPRAYLVTGPALVAGRVAPRDAGGPGRRPGRDLCAFASSLPAQTAEESRTRPDPSGRMSSSASEAEAPIGTAKAAPSTPGDSGSQAGARCIVAAVPNHVCRRKSRRSSGPRILNVSQERVRSDPIRPAARPLRSGAGPRHPPDLTASTGVNALGMRRRALLEEAGEAERAMALRGRGVLIEYLPSAVKDPRNLPLSIPTC